MVKVKQESILLEPKDIKPSSKKFEVLGTFNPAAARLPNGKIVLYVRVLEKLIKTKDKNHFYSPRMAGDSKFELKIDKFKKDNVEGFSDLDVQFKDGTKRLTFISHLRRVLLDKTGLRVEKIEKRPGFFGLEWDGELGIEDPRITKIKDLYVMTYVSLSRKSNVSTSYAISNDCMTWYRRGIIFKEQNKDVVIFPEMIDGKYVAIDRPEGNFQFTNPHMWVSYSKDLQYWGDSKPLIISKKSDWDSDRQGAGPPPIKTKEGWLLIYHGVINPRRKKLRERILKRMSIPDVFDEDDPIYSAGAALFDLKDPDKIIAKSKVPILLPIRKHEIGSFEDKSVIFPTGLVEDLDGKHVLLYSGAGDRCTTVKKISINKILTKLRAGL